MCVEQFFFFFLRRDVSDHKLLSIRPEPYVCSNNIIIRTVLIREGGVDKFLRDDTHSLGA